MIILYSFLLVIGVLLVTLLSIPVKVRLESSMVFLVRWAFLTVRVVVEGSDVQKELLLFNRKLEKRRKPEKKKKPGKEKKPQEKPKKKVPFSFIKETLQDTAVRKLVRNVLFLLRRCLIAFRIRLLHMNIGLKDYYWQGIVQGLTGSLPVTKNLQVRGNFQEYNDFLVIVHISIWRILAAIMIFLLCFPYYRAVRIYFRYRAAT